MRHGQELRAQSICLRQLQRASAWARRCQPRAQGMDRLLHRVEGFFRAREKGMPQRLLRGWRHIILPGSTHRDAALPRHPQLLHAHAILRQRASLVGAEHRCRAQSLDGGGTAGQHPRAQNAPGAHGHEDGEDDGELLGQHGHADRDACQQRFQPTAPEPAMEQDNHEAHHGTRPTEAQQHAPVAITSAMPEPRAMREPG